MSEFAAFLSYSSHHTAWVETLHRNLERCLLLGGETRKVFLDRTDLGVGQSWVAQLQAGLDAADQLIMVITPESLASPRVGDEWETFIARNRDWKGRLQLAMLVETPLPPFLEPIQFVDFQAPAGYKKALGELLSGLLGRKDRRKSPDLAEGIEIPDPPSGLLPRELRKRLVVWLAPVLKSKLSRIAATSVLGFPATRVESHPSWECAASAALVEATGDDDRIQAAQRIVKSLSGIFDEADARLDGLSALAEELAAAGDAGSEGGLLDVWLGRVEKDHSELLPFFEQRKDLPLLEEVYVQLELRPDIGRRAKPQKDELELRSGVERDLTLPQVLDLSPRQVPDLTHRWVVLGDPGAGKTTLLRHLAASLARERPAGRVPVFDSLPRLMRHREWLFDRIERQLGRDGHRAKGLGAVLEEAGREGRLVLLLDGLDEVPRDDRGDAECLLKDLSGRWPRAPIIVSSRPIGYRRPAHDYRELEVLPFDGERRREFLRRWFGRSGSSRVARARADSAAASFETDAALRDLAGNPLYLTLMALLIEKGTSLERHRTGLYDQVFQLLLDGAHRPNPRPIAAQEAVRGVLRHLAHEMTRENRDAEPVTRLEARLYKPEADDLRAPLERVPRWRRSMRPFLDDLAEQTGILGPHDGPSADWRYWHRTFREALAAEALAATLAPEGGEAALLAEARDIAEEQDLSRWAEPYALLAGRVADPDALVTSLVEANRALGLRALATAQGLKSETLDQILELTGEPEERAEVYQRLPELIDEPSRALALIDRLRSNTRNGNDLFFLERSVEAVATKWPGAEHSAEELRHRFYDHIPPPPEELFRWIETKDGRVDLWCDVPAGRFRMGSTEAEKGGYDDERPQHEVTVRSAFRMAAVPATVEQYAAFDPQHRSSFQGKVPEERIASHPVETVSWYEACAFCRWISSRLALTRGARLPSEEEWEYACRAGTDTRYWQGDDEADLAAVGWYGANSQNRTHRVGRKPANAWGLYDAHGNVWEWTQSEWTKDYSGREESVGIDPSTTTPATATSGDRVFRGGSYANVAGVARSAYRNGDRPQWAYGVRGFRVLLPAARAV